MAYVLLAIILILLLLSFFHPLTQGYWKDLYDKAGQNDLDPSSRYYPRSADIKVTRDITIRTEGDGVDNFELKVSVPKDQPGPGGYQDVVDMTYNQDPTSIFPGNALHPDTSDPSNQMMIFSRDDFSGSTELKVQLHIRTRSQEWDIDRETSGTLDQISSHYRDTYLKDQWEVSDTDGNLMDVNGDGVTPDYRMWPSNTYLAGIAAREAGNESTVYGKAKAIFDWIEESLAYPTPQQMNTDDAANWNMPKCPIRTLNDARGDCDDQSLVFITMCRSQGIPAWLEVGFLYDQFKSEWIGHGWAQVVIPLKDGTDQVCTVDCVNQEFLFRDATRFTDWVDTGGDLTVDGEQVFNLDHYYNIFTQSWGGSHSGRANLESNVIPVDFSPEGTIIRKPDGPVGTNPLIPTGNPYSSDGGMPGFELWLLAAVVPVVMCIPRLHRAVKNTRWRW